MEFLKVSGSKEAKSKKLVAFTFDDGPNADNVLSVMKILNDTNIQSTFFWIAENARKLKEGNPILFDEILGLVAEGNHEIGLHAPYDYRHSLFTRFYGKFTKTELGQAKNYLEELTGDTIRFYRPHILLQPVTMYFARQLGLTTVMGNLGNCYSDAAAPVEQQVNKFSQAQAGTILIFHDGVSMSRQSTHIMKVLPKVISNIHRNGLKPTKVSNVL